MSAPLKTFIIYARADGPFKAALRRHLMPMEQLGLLEVWDDSHLLPGEEWEKSIEEKLDASDLVLMLVSEASLYSDFIQKKELKKTLERKQRGTTQFVPILVRDCLWDLLPDFKNVQMLPLDAQRSILAVSAWLSHDSAWTAALRELHRLIPDIQQKIAAELQSRADALAAETAAQQAAETLKREQAGLAKAEKLRHHRDEGAWETALADVANADSPEEQLEIYQSYVEDHQNHRDAAEEAMHALQGKMEQAHKRALKREQAEQKRREAEADHAAFAAAHTPADLEDYLKKYSLHVEEVRQKIAALKKQVESSALEEARKQYMPEMVLIKGGTFQMGDTFGEGNGNERPVHSVTLSDFHIGKYAVTFEEYDRFCVEIKREKPGDAGWGRARRPVINVSWDDAQAYCRWLSKMTNLKFHLPTEAEWEYAAREGGKKVRFGNGKDLADPAKMNFDASEKYKQPYSIVGEYRNKTVPVGSLNSPNALGLHDLSGNVWEWCQDWYGDYPAGKQTNSIGPTAGSYRVLRGGGWGGNARDCRVAFRLYTEPVHRYNGVGFRLVLAL